LFRLSEKIRSTYFFAHVREFNCHPFQYKQFLWMHNGKINSFPRIKRSLRESLDDDYYNIIQGTTDLEHAFAFFLNQLGKHIGDYSITDLHDALIATISQINHWQERAGIREPSHLNFAVSDGYNMLVSRYCFKPGIEPPSLYISCDDRFEIQDGKYRMVVSKNQPNAVIIASEPLTAERSDWQSVARNHLVIVSPELHIQQIPIE